MSESADFDAIKRIAVAFFGVHFNEFMAQPPEALARYMDLAGVERDRIEGVIEALRSIAASEELTRKVFGRLQ